MENKKTKLTISGSPKKTFSNFDSSKTKGKKTVVIDKQKSKPLNKGSFNKSFGSKPSSNNFKKTSSFKTNFAPKAPVFTSDFERRKLAEQRATKRLKGVVDTKEKKSKSDTKKRELKLTV